MARIPWHRCWINWCPQMAKHQIRCSYYRTWDSTSKWCLQWECRCMEWMPSKCLQHNLLVILPLNQINRNKGLNLLPNLMLLQLREQVSKLLRAKQASKLQLLHRCHSLLPRLSQFQLLRPLIPQLHPNLAFSLLDKDPLKELDPRQLNNLKPHKTQQRSRKVML